MINNLIKLFYSEVVKTKMSKLPNKEYELREGCKEFQNITLKIDSIFFKSIKVLLSIFILYLSFQVKILLGIGVLLVEVAYLLYKVSYEKQVKDIIKNAKNNIEISADNLIDESVKKGINLLITLLVISLLTGFNYFIGVSFVIVFIYTARSLYVVFRE